MILEVYSAFRKAGVPEEDARQAAEALPVERLATKSDVTGIKQDLAIIKQMLGIVIAAQVFTLIKSIGLL